MANELDLAQRLIEANGPLAHFHGPVPEEAILAAEAELEVRFPPSYRRFLSAFGFGSFGGIEICGLGMPKLGFPNVVWATQDERRLSTEFPRDFVLVYDGGEGEIFCIDARALNGMDEGRVVTWIPGLPLRLQTLEKIADSFGEFFLASVRTQIELHS